MQTLFPGSAPVHGLAAFGALLTCFAVVLNVGPFAKTRTLHDAPLAAADNSALERWAEGAIELFFVNAGPDCQLAFWRMTSDLKSELSLNELAGFAHAAADICRGAGAQAALASIQALPVAARRLPSSADIALWARGLVRLAR